MKVVTCEPLYAATGVYRYIYPKISNRFVHVWDINRFNTCFKIAMTSLKKRIPPKIKFLATPLVTTYHVHVAK